MRLKHVFAGLLAALVCGLGVAQPAAAGGGTWRYSYEPAYVPVYYKKAYPRHKHRYATRPVVAVYAVTDPYAYRYEARGYYPYYDAGYWRPLCASASSCVPSAFQSPYWKAWGYPKPWSNREFHRVYHGRIKPWHW
jgi:hypothetical protein